MAPAPGWGKLTLNERVIEIVDTGRLAVIVTVQVKAIECAEVTSEQVAKSKIAATVLFGVWGGLAAKGAEDRGALLVHMKSGQTGYFSIGDYSQQQILGKITPWLHSCNIHRHTSH